MAVCIEEFGFIKNRNFKKLLGSIFATEEFLLQDVNSTEWIDKINELSNYIIGESNKKSAIQSYNIGALYNSLKVAIDNVFNNFITANPESLWNLQTDKLEEVKQKIANIVKKEFISDVKIDTNPIINGAYLFDFSKLSDLLYDLDSFRNYLDNKINLSLFKTIFLNVFGKDSDTKFGKYERFVVTDAQLNKNIKVLKNELWGYMVNFYEHNRQSQDLWKIKDTLLYPIENLETGEVGSKLNTALFEISEKTGTSYYTEVVSFIQDLMDKTIIHGGNTKIIHEGRTTVSQAYINSLILANFDEFLVRQHSDKIKVDQGTLNTFGNPENGNFKYRGNFKLSTTTKSFGDEMASSIEHSTSGIVKMIANVIPFYEEGKSRAGTYWKPLDNGQTVGKINISALGAVLNDLNPNLTVYYENVGYSIGQLLVMYDNAQITFKEILDLLLGEYVPKISKEEKERREKLPQEELQVILDKEAKNARENSFTAQNNNLITRREILKSIQQFLYGPNGIANQLNDWRHRNPQLADLVINPEVALINHIRTSAKNSYITSTNRELNTKTKTLDVLDLDSLVKYDFEKLLSNLMKNWKVKKLTTADVVGIKSFDDFVNFLNDANKGGMEISETAKRNFLKNPDHKMFAEDATYFQREVVQKHLLKLAGHKEFTDKPIEGKEGMIQREYSELLEGITNSEVNSALYLVELFKETHRESKHSTITNIKNSEGASMPTIGISNLATLFNIAVNKTNNFFLRNPGLYKRTSILMEVVGKHSAKPVNKLNAKELFKLNFTRFFIESGITNNEMIVQPWDFSDKPKIYGVVVDTKKLINGEKSISEMNSNSLKEVFFKEQSAYYTTLLNSIYDDFYNLNSWNYKGLSNKSKLQKIEEFFETINNEAESANADAGEQIITPIQILYHKINNKFNSGEYLEMTLDLHYSIYGGKLKVNQFLKGNFQIFNDKNLFDIYAGLKESALIETSGMSSIPLSEIMVGEGISFNGAKVNKIKSFDPSAKFLQDKDGNDSELILSENGLLTEIAKKYLWAKNLVISQYANMTVKDVFLHPAKGVKFEEIDFSSKAKIQKSFAKYIEEEDKRSIAFTKRMNVPGASIAIYGKNKEGIGTTIKVAAITDPRSQSYNYLGEIQDHDSEDGSGRMNPFLQEIMKKAMPDFNIQSSQKPLGESITSKTSTTLKFATFALSNEEIRISEFSPKSGYQLMKKMNSIPIWSDNKYINLFGFKTNYTIGEGNYYGFGFDEQFEGYAIPVNGVYKLVSNVRYDGDNLYTMVFNDNTTKQFKVDTLFDLWEALGGAYSAKLEDGKITHNEYSIQIIGSLINKHAIFNPEFKIKDKMIGMVLPTSAIKKGATNINPYQTAYSGDNQLSYFNFDTAFFGIQLDPFHSTEDASTNEITQVISAIAERASTPELFNEIYNGLGNIIKRGLDKFNLAIKDGKDLDNLKKLFIDNLEHSSQINNARAILNGLAEDVSTIIPLDNKTIYKQFVSFIIAKINSDFVRRSFPGSSSVLRPSHGFMMLFEDSKGRKYLPIDLLNKYEFLKGKSLKFKELADQLERSDFSSESARILAKTQLVLNNSEDFKSKDITVREIRPLDKISLDLAITTKEGEIILESGEYDLTEVSDYFRIKKILKNVPADVLQTLGLKKVFNKARDLKPEDGTIIQKIITTQKVIENGVEVVKNIPNEIHRSLYDLEAVEFKYELNNKIGVVDTQKYKDFVEYIKIVDPASLEADDDVMYEIVKKYAERWVIRSFDLAKENKIFKEYDQIVSETTDGRNPFEKMFSYTTTDASGVITEYVDDFIARRDFSKEQYIEFVDILGYEHRRPENIHSNVHKNNFGIGDIPYSEVTKNTFKITDSDLVGYNGQSYDAILYNSIDKTYLSVVVNNKNYKERDGVLYERRTLEALDRSGLTVAEGRNVKNFGTKVLNILTDYDEEGNVYRISNYGERMYKLPKNYSIYRDYLGRETLVLGASENEDNLEALKDFMKDYKTFDIIVTKDDGYNTTDNLLNPEESDYQLKFLKALKKHISIPSLNRYMNEKINSYTKFKKAVQPIDETQTVLKDELYKSFKRYLGSHETKSILHNFLDKLARDKYLSFKKSIESISARIPAQGMQSFMSMDTVGYIKGSSNDVYVSHWQLWLQGSDYDIDKLYMMMYGFRNGLFQGWSPYFRISKFETSKKLPLPIRENIYGTDEEIRKLNGVEIAQTFENTFDLDTLDLNSDKKFFLENLIESLTVLNKRTDVQYITSSIPGLVNAINTHNKFYSETGFKNFVLTKLIDTADDLRNRNAAMSPISFGVFEDFKKSNNPYNLSPYDGFTMGSQQEQNSVGKDVIGIAATGLKNYFALLTYFSNYYNNLGDREIDVKDNEFFSVIYNINGKNYHVNKIQGINLKESDIQKLQKTSKLSLSSILDEEFERGQLKQRLKVELLPFIKTGNEAKFIQEIDKLSKITHDEDAALLISSILSLATDNAKELVLAKINAGVEFAGMHIYLLSMGIDPKVVVDFMTGPTGKKMQDSVKSDIFESSYPRNVGQRIEEVRNKIQEPELKNNAYTFTEIYNDAQEFTVLGQLLKANQGSKASQEELKTLLDGLRNVLIMRKKTFEKQISDRFEFKKDENPTLNELVRLSKPYLSKEYIDGILGVATQKNVIDNVIDLKKFFEDSDYQKVVTDYYNLIKGTINILHILPNLSHFKYMFKSFVVGEDALARTTNKMYLLGNLQKTSDAIVAKYGSDLNYNVLKAIKLAGKIDNPSVVNKDVMSSINDFYDNRVIFEFLKGYKNEINLLKVMEILGLSSITLLEHDISTVKTKEYTSEDLTNQKLSLINLGTPHGIAQFRFIMENEIIPYFKSTYPNNGFLKNYTFGSYLSYNLRKKIGFYLDPSNFEDLEDLEMGMSELVDKAYDSGIRKISYNFNVMQNKVGNLQPTKVLDLLTLYNLITNEGRFGGNRASNLFYRDLNNPNSIARSFIDFERNAGSDFANKLIKSLEDDDKIRDVLLFKLFAQPDYTNNDKPMLLNLGEKIDAITVNRYYSHSDDITEGRISKEVITLGENIGDSLSANNIMIERDCKPQE
jgi:hypothetical protein